MGKKNLLFFPMGEKSMKKGKTEGKAGEIGAIGKRKGIVAVDKTAHK